jgi:hypothetical protein
MSYPKSELRQAARITRVFEGREDHGICTVLVNLEGAPSGGWGQGFGGLALKDEGEITRFTKEVCETFDVANARELVGQTCTALYATSPFGTVEGIEAPSGKRFTIRGYRLRHHPEYAQTPTVLERARLQGEVQFHTRRAEESRIALAQLGELVDWETEPRWTP